MGRTLLLVVAALFAGGCSAVIVPPPTPRGDAAPVLVADYGYHSTLILPRAEGGGLIEYAYGDWTYFGRNQKTLGTALHALLMSDQATLGRRVLYLAADDPGLAAATGAQSVIRFEAPREKVAALERALDERYSSRLDSITFSPVHHLYFVKDAERYGVTNNCNHFTARGLERLGCQVEGVVMMSGFRVREVGGAATTRPTTRPAGTAQSAARHGAGNS
jgi:hypothetical protein